ncbi:hypothetical protein SAMN04487897_13120 [Paenibacillus sp. yr247]|uniref:hypothetical protein n=1 Tax=Paenibacillus sp. yr247 TaxID=1761880 RepID=UPI00088A43EE|nr:hypothetical protein [Paenibacillus sp. yr247]SDP02152.1 hypothetical protein SAMN04487897_13120 [Paenibacillus sp. yr247]
MRRKLIRVITLVILIMSILAPSQAFAAPLTSVGPHMYLDGDPWYVKMISTLIDTILKVFGGIHEPADHVFYCSTFSTDPIGPSVDGSVNRPGCADKVWGFVTQDKFDHVLRRGFVIFSFAITFIITAAFIKVGILSSTRQLSSTLKVETTETLIKCLVGLILIANFFNITGTLFKANNMVVSVIYQDIKAPLDLSSTDPSLNGNMTSKVPTDSRVKLNDFAKDQSGLNQVIVKLATTGLSIWWEVFYLQRFMFIALLIVLAPLWIAVMFYPMLQSITMAAFKELWSQITAQAIHAGLFWLYFNLFDNNLDWFHVTVAMALFIPLSESVRFIFGATSETGSKLAMAGTAAGLGSLLHAGRAISDVRNGFSAVKQLASGSAEKQTATTEGTPGSSPSTNIGRHILGAGGTSSNKGASVPGGSPNGFASRMRMGGEIASGLGAAAMRFAGQSMGVGLGPMAQNIFAEAGSAVGEGIGYRVGAGAVAGTQGAADYKRNVQEHYKEAKEQMEQDPRYKNSDPATKAALKAAPAVSSAIKGFGGGTAGTDDPKLQPSYQRQAAEKKLGAVAETLFGRGGYQMGEAFAKSRIAGTTLAPQNFTPDQSVFTVETRDGSFLATEEDGSFRRISNIHRGNSSLQSGQMVAKEYKAHKENGEPFSFKPNMISSLTKPGALEEAPAYTFNSEGQKLEYQGKTANPINFMEKGRPSNHIDLRRRNVSVPSLIRKP